MLIVIAFGVLLEFDLDAAVKKQRSVEGLRLSGRDESRVNVMMKNLEFNSLDLHDREDLSLKWSWGAKKALSEASGFYGESIDTVRAGAMVSV